MHFFENFQMKSRILASFKMKTAQKGVIRRLSEFPKIRKFFRFLKIIQGDFFLDIPENQPFLPVFDPKYWSI